MSYPREVQARYSALREERFHEGRESNLLERILLSEKRTRQLKKDYWKTAKGDTVKSFGELLIADYLFERGINYLYERRVDIGKFHAVPDFTLPGWTYRLFIEFWGMNTAEYTEKIPARRRKLNKQPGYNLIDVYPGHLQRIEAYLDAQIHEKRAGVLHV